MHFKMSTLLKLYVYGAPAEVVEGAACSPVREELSAVLAEPGVELVEGGADGLWVAGSWTEVGQ